MTISLPISERPTYAVAEKALRRWVTERLRREPGPDGTTVYRFALSGSTCSNMGRPVEVVMTVTVGADGRVRAATARPADGDSGCDAMCAAQGDGRRFLSDFGDCNEAVGLTLHKKIGDPVEKGEPLATIHANRESVDAIIERVRASIRVADRAEKPSLIHDVITAL